MHGMVCHKSLTMLPFPYPHPLGSISKSPKTIALDNRFYSTKFKSSPSILSSKKHKFVLRGVSFMGKYYFVLKIFNMLYAMPEFSTTLTYALLNLLHSSLSSILNFVCANICFFDLLQSSLALSLRIGCLKLFLRKLTYDLILLLPTGLPNFGSLLLPLNFVLGLL